MHRFTEIIRFGRKQSRLGAFTLIEVLASMAVLLVVMMALMRMFGDASMAYNKGTKTLSRNASVRAVLDMVGKDIEGMVVDNRHACFKQAGTTGGMGFDDLGFDEIYFVTTAGDQNDGRDYQLVHYYVEQKLANYGLETGVIFRLMKATCKLSTAYDNNVDTMISIPTNDVANTYKRWWWKKTPGLVSQLVAENIVRFDVYIQSQDGDLMGGDLYDSTKPVDYAGGSWLVDKPPAFIDFYVQVASDDAMQKAGLILKKSPAATDMRDLAYSELYRDSSMLFRRMVPGQSIQREHPIAY